MLYSQNILDEIRARLPVSRVVERRVKLKRAGREYVGLSPFKTERTPSFTVNDAKGFYHCFASGEHGDIFTFVMRTEGLSFVEAAERLASEAGIALPRSVPETQAAVSREKKLRAALEAAAAYFQASLAGSEGTAARSYIASRGLCDRDVAAFRLGYAPARRNGVISHLLNQGFDMPVLQDAGLVIHGEDIAVPYDRFRGRLMFPISDRKGGVVAFGARALAAEQQPKYLNSPETALFHKGGILFNFASARPAAIAAGNTVIVAEGYMDVIAIARAGYPNAVAPLGTALTPDQLKLLWSMSPSPTLCFDGDSAGLKAAHRALDTALPFLEPGRSLQFVLLPGGQDPDDMLRDEGVAAFKACIEKPLPLFDVLWEREAGTGSKGPDARAQIEDRLMGLAGTIVHQTLRFHYRTAIRERLRAMGHPSQGKTGRGAVPSPSEAWKERTATFLASTKAARRVQVRKPMQTTDSLMRSAAIGNGVPPGAAREALIVRLLLTQPGLLERFSEEVAAMPFESKDCAAIRDALVTLSLQDTTDGVSLLERLQHLGLDACLDRVQGKARSHACQTEGSVADADAAIETWHELTALHRHTATVKNSLGEAEEDYFKEPTDANFQRICAIRHNVEIALR